MDVAAPGPVRLTEHDTYAWSPVTDDMPVTDAVRVALLKHWEASGLAG